MIQKQSFAGEPPGVKLDCELMQDMLIELERSPVDACSLVLMKKAICVCLAMAISERQSLREIC